MSKTLLPVPGPDVGHPLSPGGRSVGGTFDLSPVPEDDGMRWNSEEALRSRDTLVSPMVTPLSTDSVGLESESVRRLRPRVHAVGKQASTLEHFKEPSRPDEWLPHKQEREKDLTTREQIARAVRQDPVCALLDEQAVGKMVGIAEYFEFEVGQTLVQQGDISRYFFAIHTGVLEVSCSSDSDAPRRTTSMLTGARPLGAGECFGGSAVLYNSTQSETVVALETCGVWGILGDTFRKVLSDDAMQNYEKNYGFLNDIRLFDSFSPKQKEQLGRLALFNEVHEVGSLVLQEGQAVRAMYFVKEGELSVHVGAEVDSAGNLTRTNRVSQLHSGDSFGKSAALYRMGISKTTVVADTRCELLCIGVDELHDVFGADISGTLERNFVLKCLEKSPFLSRFSLPQKRFIAERMVIKDYHACQKLDISDLEEFIILLSGGISGQINEGSELHLARGQVRDNFKVGGSSGSGESLDFISPTASHCTASMSSSLAYPDSPVRRPRSSVPLASFAMMMQEDVSNLRGEGGTLEAGPQGARIATISQQALTVVLRELGVCSILDRTGREAMEHARRVQMLQQVVLFRHLAVVHLDGLARALLRERRSLNDMIFEEGHEGRACWFIVAGQVEELQVGSNDAKRTLGEGECLGARALAFQEPRPSGARALCSPVELLRLERSDYERVLPEVVREELAQWLQLRDTPVELDDLKHVSVIGCGTFGSVRCVEHRKTRFRYALKRVKLIDGKVPELVARERDLLAEVSHPFILRLAGAFDTEAGAYLLTELLTGGELLAALDDIGRVLTWTEAQFYAGSLILALEVLHEANIVFRDLKPENVMLDARGYLRLIDFGVAKQLDSSCRTFTIIGSFHFMAPEVACGKGYSTEADIWSLGVMLFEFVCGILPFGRDLPASSPHAILRAVQTDNLAFPDHYRDNIGKHCIRGMLRKEPERRLGAGINGFEAIKSHDFFALAEGGSSLFDRILSRAVQPPYFPQREKYGDPDTLREVTLSDSERFA